MAAADRLHRGFVRPHLWWRRSLFAGKGLLSLGVALKHTNRRTHTQSLFLALLFHTVSVHPSLLCLFLPLPLSLTLSLPSLLWQIQAVGGGAGTLFPPLSLFLSLALSLFSLSLTHRSTPPTHGVIINTSTISIFHTVCLEKARELGLVRVVRESESARDAKKDL